MLVAALAAVCDQSASPSNRKLAAEELVALF
jgi:hypothetical protein